MEEVIFQKFLEWLREDAPFWDETTECLIEPDIMAEAVVIAKSDGVLAGAELMSSVLRKLGLEVELVKRDGDYVRRGDIVLRIRGSARKILTVERTLLNVLMHMSGVATATRRLLERARRVNPRVRVAATRKTLPGLRLLEKLAVRIGGGDTHRLSLSDCVLIKDNHLAIVGSVREAVRRAREKASFTRKIEVEVTTPEQALEAARAGADIILLDNMSPDDIRKTIELLERHGLRDKVILEASGGITEENVEEYARTGVDVISSGAITHSAQALDMSLEIVRWWRD